MPAPGLWERSPCPGPVFTSRRYALVSRRGLPASTRRRCRQRCRRGGADRGADGVPAGVPAGVPTGVPTQPAPAARVHEQAGRPGLAAQRRSSFSVLLYYYSCPSSFERADKPRLVVHRRDEPPLCRVARSTDRRSPGAYSYGRYIVMATTRKPRLSTSRQYAGATARPWPMQLWPV